MSAFEFYSRQKKKPIALKIRKPKTSRVNGQNSFQSSTPLPVVTLFSPAPEEERLSENIFLSPILGKSKKKAKKSKKRRKEMENNDKVDGGGVSDDTSSRNGESTSVKRKKFKGMVLPKEPVSNDSSSEEIASGTVSDAKEDEMFRKKEKKLKRKRVRTEEDPPDPKIARLVEADSVEEGKMMLAWIISPVTIEDFFENYWEKKPLHIARNCTDYFRGICSKKDMERAFRENQVYFNKTVTITSYQNGVRTNDEMVGRVRPSIVWKKFEDGKSIRMMNPQSYIPNIATLCTTLQVSLIF